MADEVLLAPPCCPHCINSRDCSSAEMCAAIYAAYTPLTFTLPVTDSAVTKLARTAVESKTAEAADA